MCYYHTSKERILNWKIKKFFMQPPRHRCVAVAYRHSESGRWLPEPKQAAANPWVGGCRGGLLFNGSTSYHLHVSHLISKSHSASGETPALSFKASPAAARACDPGEISRHFSLLTYDSKATQWASLNSLSWFLRAPRSASRPAPRAP